MCAKLCVIGDSITGGVIYKDVPGRYVKCRESFVNLLAAALGIDVHNHSRFGCTTTAALERFGRYEADAADCDWTLVMLGGNDCDFNWQEVAAAPEAAHECNTPIGRFRENYGELLERIAAAGGRPIAMNPIPVFGRSYFRWISKRADARGVIKFLGNTETIEHWNEMYSLAVLREAAARNVPILDARSAFLFRRVFNPYFSTDGIHPSAEGHRALFEYLLPQLEELLGRSGASLTAAS